MDAAFAKGSTIPPSAVDSFREQISTVLGKKLNAAPFFATGLDMPSSHVLTVPPSMHDLVSYLKDGLSAVLEELIPKDTPEMRLFFKMIASAQSSCRIGNFTASGKTWRELAHR